MTSPGFVGLWEVYYIVARGGPFARYAIHVKRVVVGMINPPIAAISRIVSGCHEQKRTTHPVMFGKSNVYMPC